MSENHCVDCCCARSWKALEVSEYDGRSIPEHIQELKDANREWALNAAKTQSGWFIETIAELHNRIRELEASQESRNDPH